MAEKRSIEVLIGGKVYKIAGTESEEHMRKVATFLNERLAQVNQALGGRAPSQEYLMTLTAINICDDVIKLVEHARRQQDSIDTLKKQQKTLEETLAAYEEDLLDLETELLALKETSVTPAEDADEP